MDFLVLSLPETAGLWLGLATQALIRNATLALWGPRIIVGSWFLYLWSQAGQAEGGYGRFLRYAGTTLVVLVLFWPETLRFGGCSTTDATRVGSYGASQDPSAALRSAWDTGLVQPEMQGPVCVPWGLWRVLKAWQDFWLTLAKTINSETHRTFPHLLPMHWLLGSDTGLTAPIVAATGDWVHNCYVPALTQTLEGQEARTSQDLSPWSEGAIQTALSTREVVPGTQQGLTFIGPPGVQTMRCYAYLQAIESLVQARIFDAKSPNGTPLSEVFQQELGLDTIAQARFVLIQEMRRAEGPSGPAASLLNQYLGLRGLKVALDAGSGALAGRLGGGVGALIGGLLGGLRGVSGELEFLINGLTWLLRIALMINWFLPYILGQILFVTLSVFPVLLLLALMYRWTSLVLGSYIMFLGFFTSAPFWFAVVHQFSKWAVSHQPQVGEGWDATIFSVMTSSTWEALMSSFGILIVGPTLSALLLGAVGYGAYRGASSLLGIMRGIN